MLTSAIAAIRMIYSLISNYWSSNQTVRRNSLFLLISDYQSMFYIKCSFPILHLSRSARAQWVQLQFQPSYIYFIRPSLLFIVISPPPRSASAFTRNSQAAPSTLTIFNNNNYKTFAINPNQITATSTTNPMTASIN